jgi:hypothetical protein
MIEPEEGACVIRPDAPVDGGFKNGALFRVIAEDTDVQL